ncbi:unnamed protein product [Staurois parvus]|uniref:Uncharacterized protein n=1 Tax=Staurois parvus TaxID=386267 RepID=A0ABN9DE41_9NEOB|nr:unnamed protein product [Staurois parvus]
MTIGVPLCPEDTAGTGSRCCTLPGSAHKRWQCRVGHSGTLIVVPIVVRDLYVRSRSCDHCLANQ